MTPCPPDSPDQAAPVYGYDDFRLFLKDRFESRKCREPSYSHRKFATEAGFTNPGFLNDVIKGRRKLSGDAVEKMIKGFSLSVNEAEFFRLLVTYGQAKRDRVRQDAFRRIVSRRNRSNFTRLNPALSRYYQDYRYPLLRSAVMSTDFRGDYEALGTFVFPQIGAGLVKKYVRDLCEWGLLVQGPDGKYRATDQFVTSPATLGEQVKQLNREWIAHAVDALMRLPRDKRNITTMLLAVSPDVALQINEVLEKTRTEIWEMVKRDSNDPSCIMQLNIQYFPRSRKKERK